MNLYPLKFYHWENEMGAMVDTVGFEIDDDHQQRTVAAQLEIVSETDVVPAGVLHIPNDNIHYEDILEYRRTA